MKSLNQLEKEGLIKRKDAPTALLSAIHIEPGFNLGNRHEDNDEEDEALYKHIVSGGRVPALEVRAAEDGKLFAVDCHRRVTQLNRAAKLGVEQVPHLFNKNGDVRVEIVLVDGGYIARNLRLLTSNEEKKLTPLQRAEGYLRLAEGGESEPPLTSDEIAEKVHKTRQHVDQMLHLARAPQAIKQAVIDGKVSATEAFTMVRRHGEQATEKLKEAQGKAEAIGKGKVTGKSIKPWTPPAKYVAPVMDSARQLIKTLPKELRAHLATDKPLTEGETVEVDAGWMRQLLTDMADVQEAERAAKQKARDKAAKAAQVDMADGA